HPTVWAAFLRTVTRALDDFLERDLPVLLQEGVTRLETEEELKAPLRAGARTIAVKGKIDRIALLAGGSTRGGDYKTGRSFAKPLLPARIRRGTALQLPLYARMVAGTRAVEDVVAEVLNVPLRPERDRDGAREKEVARPLLELESLSEAPLAALGEL